MRGYRLVLLDESADLWSITPQADGEDNGKGVVRSGIGDALYWIQVQEEIRR
jgi:hypothetical protein